MTCFRFTSFEFAAVCSACLAFAEAHLIDLTFFCAACCPGCVTVDHFDDAALPATVGGEQSSLF